jgi:hypothetical protein
MSEQVEITDPQVIAAREDFLEQISEENKIPCVTVRQEPIDPGKRSEQWGYFDVLDELEREILAAIAELEKKLASVRS